MFKICFPHQCHRLRDDLVIAYILQLDVKGCSVSYSTHQNQLLANCDNCDNVFIMLPRATATSVTKTETFEGNVTKHERYFDNV